MKIDKWKYQVACARACMNTSDVVAEAELKRSTLNSCMKRQGGSPATIGKIAKVLGVDVLDIIETEGEK